MANPIALPGTNVPTGSAISPGGAAGLQGVNVIQSFGAHLEAPAVKSYYLDVSAPVQYTVLGLYAIMGSGTATIQLLVGGTLVTGSTLSVTTTLSSVNLAQVVSQGQMLQLQVTAQSGNDLGFSVRIQR